MSNNNESSFDNGNYSSNDASDDGNVYGIDDHEQSGNEDAADELGDAFNLLQTKYRIHFAFYDCFLVLRNSPKWNDEIARRDAKLVRKQAVKAGNKRTITASCAPGSSAATEVGTSTVIAEDEDGESDGSIIARPKGRKKSKNHASMDKKITDSLANWEANQQQLADEYAVLMKKIDMANAIKQEKLAVNKSFWQSIKGCCMRNCSALIWRKLNELSILGLSAAITPFLNTNQSTRVTFQSGMALYEAPSLREGDNTSRASTSTTTLTDNQDSTTVSPHVDNATTVLSNTNTNGLDEEELAVTEGEDIVQIERAAVVAADMALAKSTQRVYGRKVDLMFIDRKQKVELCSSEWKKRSVSLETLLCQQTKNLRVSKCIFKQIAKLDISLPELQSLSIDIMDWRGFDGYILQMQRVNGVYLVNLNSTVHIPTHVTQIKNFKDSLISLFKWKDRLVELQDIISSAKAASSSSSSFNGLINARKRTPSPDDNTFFSPKRSR
ncbi:hypothetical protein INT47_009089 [Mucor saturninus]|uniref:No apical meristem-associated C-terminal domain-containing protein n=1 Tax=Mucor saturninus TaxID=64648 RepID=A0A8H7RLM6_9FUNG|nr:hypothetical protein INT47_009089 [Mucor saturninus]